MKESVTGMAERCRECGGETALHSYKHTEKVGPWTVTDGSAMQWQCLACGAPQLSLDDLQTYQLRAAKTALCQGKTEGGVFRYARKVLGLTQKELGVVIDRKHETISRWENGESDEEEAPRAATAALVGVICRVIEGELPEEMVQAARTMRETPQGDGSEGGELVVLAPQPKLRKRC
jgi:DNA-binding XRE family transcriptional regulator